MIWEKDFSIINKFGGKLPPKLLLMLNFYATIKK